MTEILDTKELEAQRSPRPPQQEKPVEKFIDSRGIERRSDYPIVLLDREAEQAIDDYYKEHDQLADTTEATIDEAKQLETVDVSEDRFLKAITLDLSPTTSPQEEGSQKDTSTEEDGTEHLSENQSLLKELTDDVEAIDSEIRDIAVFPPDASFKDLKAFYEGLPEKVRVFIDQDGGPPEFGLGVRFSGGKKSSLRVKIILGLDRYESDLKERRRLGSKKLAEELADQLADGLGEAAAELGITVPETCQFSEYESPESQEKVQQGKTPTENIALLDKNLARMRDIEQIDGQIEAASEVIAAAIQDPLVQEALAKLDELERNAIAWRVNHVIQESVKQSGALESLAAIQKGKQFALELADIQTQAATHAVYQEVALPVDYVSDIERERLQDLEEKRAAQFDKSPRVASDEAKKRIEAARKETLGEIIEAAIMYFHTTSYIEAIMASGELQPKQRQIDTSGILHEQTRPASGSEGSTLTTHSSVPHFAKRWQPGYMRGGNEEGFHNGVVALPIGAIVKHASFDTNSKQLTILPSARPNNWSYTGVTSRGSGEIEDDYVFYSSPELANRDDYGLPISEEIVGVIDNPRDPVEVPEALNEKVVVAKDESELISVIDRKIEEVKVQYRGKMVVPLRQAPLEYKPESPRVGTGFRDMPQIYEKLEASQLRGRQHANPRERIA